MEIVIYHYIAGGVERFPLDSVVHGGVIWDYVWGCVEDEWNIVMLVGWDW